MNRSRSLILLIVITILLPVYCLAQTNAETTKGVIGEWRGAITSGGRIYIFDLNIKPTPGGLSGEMSLNGEKAPVAGLKVEKEKNIALEIPGVMKLTGEVVIFTGPFFNSLGDIMGGEVIANSQKGIWYAHKIESGGEKLAVAREYAVRGKSHFEKENYRKAIGDYTEAIKFGSQTAGIYASRGRVYRYEADRQKAAAEYMSITAGEKITPTSAILDLNLAIDDFSRALKMDSNVAHMFFNERGLAHLKKCELDEKDTSDCQLAVGDFNQAIKLSPNTGAYYLNRASVYKKLGMAVQAEADERKAAELKGNP